MEKQPIKIYTVVQGLNNSFIASTTSRRNAEYIQSLYDHCDIIETLDHECTGFVYRIHFDETLNLKSIDSDPAGFAHKHGGEIGFAPISPAHRCTVFVEAPDVESAITNAKKMVKDMIVCCADCTSYDPDLCECWRNPKWKHKRKCSPNQYCEYGEKKE